MIEGFFISLLTYKHKILVLRLIIMEFIVEKVDIIKMGLRRSFFKVEADSLEEAEKLAETVIDDDMDAFDVDYDIEETEYLESHIREN